MLALVLSLLGRGFAQEPAPRTVDVFIDLSDPASGWLGMKAVFHDLDRRGLTFRQMGRSPEFEYESVTFSGTDGTLAATLKEHTWTVLEPPEGPITVTWRVKPGGMGRHGHQGYIDPAWAAFDGRILLLPSSRYSVRRARFKIERPEGWTVVHPWVEQDGWLVAEDNAHLKSMVTATCMAVGKFDVRERQFGETTMRVGAMSRWDPAHKEVLFEKTFDTFAWFHEELGYDRKHPFTIAWLPKPNDKQVFGGASVNGACYQHPVERERNWLLLGHRIGHPYNKYTPSGMTIRDAADHWFMEGWASYIEVVAAAGSGALADQSYWNTLYSRYLRDIDAHPEWDMALRDEPKSGKAHEFLHYTKGPLVVKHLDVLMRQRSGVNLEGFMRKMHDKYGFHRAVFPLREEVEAFTGDSYDDFWEVFVDNPGAAFPVWPEVLTEEAEARRETQPIAWIGDRPVHPEYVRYLAWRGGFERYADLADFLVASAHKENVLRARGLPLLPTSLEAHRFVLPVQGQHALARTALAWRAESVPARSGCMGGGDPKVPKIRWSESADGLAFRELLELEAVYEEKLGRRIAHVEARDGKGRRVLVVGSGQTISLHTTWTATPPRAGFELHVDGKTTKAKQITIDPSWTRTHVRFRPKDRPPNANVLTFGIGPDTKPQLEFPLWQSKARFLKPDERKADEDEPEEAPAEAEPDAQEPR